VANDFSQRFAASYCSSIQGCCQRFGENFDLASCQDAVRGYLTALLNAELANPNVVFDEQVAGQCIDAYAAALRACTEQNVATGEACEGLFRGTVELGGACGESSECIQSPEQPATCDTGVCVADELYFSPYDLEPAALGEPCSATCEGDIDGSSSCSGTSTANPSAGPCWVNDGLICGSTGVCMPAPQVGEPCPQYFCTAGAYCASGTCQPASSDGPCTDSVSCLPTSYCDFATSLCTPRKPDGEACNADDECLGGACEADRCRVWSVASAESCAGLLD
jgi:hypothetical protein